MQGIFGRILGKELRHTANHHMNIAAGQSSALGVRSIHSCKSCSTQYDDEASGLPASHMQTAGHLLLRLPHAAVPSWTACIAACTAEERAAVFVL